MSPDKPCIAQLEDLSPEARAARLAHLSDQHILYYFRALHAPEIVDTRWLPLVEAEMRKRQAEQDKLESSKTDVGWGHQIRSYVLDQSRVKDLRTNVEMSNTKAVLDGDLDDFISASLKQGV